MTKKTKLEKSVDDLERLLRNFEGEMTTRDEQLIEWQRNYARRVAQKRHLCALGNPCPNKRCVKAVHDAIVDTWELNDHTRLPNRTRACLAHVCACDIWMPDDDRRHMPSYEKKAITLYVITNEILRHAAKEDSRC